MPLAQNRNSSRSDYGDILWRAIEKEQINAEKLTRLEKIKIPENFKFEKATSISSEGRQKLTELRPKTIGQASRISGVSPSDISVLLVHLGR